MNAARLRPGYTLLEVLLATAIGVMLLAAVYVALDVQLNSAQAGRDVIEQTTLARSVLARMSDDISLSLGTVDPGRYRRSGGQGGGSAAPAPAPAPSSGSNTSGSGTSGGNTGQSGSGSGQSGGSSSQSGGSSGQSSGGASTSGAAETSDGTVTFNQYVQGTSTALTLYVSRVPRELTIRRNPDEVENLATFSDLRRVTYWLAGGDVPVGLARQEIKIATSDDALGPLPPDIEDEAAYVIPAAETIQSLQFSYFDGTQWLDSWDGAAPGSDGRTPLGPPRAIAIVLGIAPPPSRAAAGETELQYYRHVIAIPTANGAAQQAGTATTGP